jgi:hypothetical protein
MPPYSVSRSKLELYLPLADGLLSVLLVPEV